MVDEALALRAAKKIKQLQAEVAQYLEAIENLKATVAKNLPVGDTILYDPETEESLKATVYTAKQYNEAYGKKNRPDLWTAHAVTKLVLDSATAKKELTPEEYAEFQKPSDKVSVKVEVVND